MSYTDQQLQDVWNRYVGMKQADLISITDPGSAVYEPAFTNALGYIYTNSLFGFANRGPAAGSNSCPNNAGIFNGPTHS